VYTKLYKAGILLASLFALNLALTASPAVQLLPLTASKSFVALVLPVGSSTNLNFFLTNPNTGAAVTGIAFSDTLPAGLTFAFPGNYSFCGGSVVLTASTFTLSGATLAASATCAGGVTVNANTAGVMNNITGPITTANAGTTPGVSATLTVVGPVTLTKAFGTPILLDGGSTTLAFVVANPNASSASNVGFTDTLPGGLVISTPNGLSGSCGGGAITGTAGSNIITLAGATLAGGTSCTFALGVTSDGTLLGNMTNVTGTVSATVAGFVVTGNAATAAIFVGPVPTDSAFQVRYAANLQFGESYINIVNDGANGAPPLGPGLGGAVGNICVNVYAFDPNEEMVSCCSCLVTPDQVKSLAVTRDLTSNTATGVTPTSLTVKLLATLAGANGTGTSCSNAASAVTAATIVGGYTAYGTTLHATPTAGAFATAETRFTSATLSASELAHLANTCSNMVGNLSGFGICASCRNGALGAPRM
jgi:hypothetical protein